MIHNDHVRFLVDRKKLKPDKFFMGKPSQNYGVPPKYSAHLQPGISEHTPP